MGGVQVHRLRYVYSDKSGVPNVDTDDQQRLAELMSTGWQIQSHSVVSLGQVASGSLLSEAAVAYEAHLLLSHPG